MDTDEIIDRLYDLPPAEFTRARNEAAGELRTAGQRDAAEQVKALRKPTSAAAAVNRLVREHRGEVDEFLRAAVSLRDAQLSGHGDLTVAMEQERAALEGLVRICGEVVRQTLLAAAADDDAARQLRAARLERELEPRGFGTLLAHAQSPSAEPTAQSGAQAKQATPARTKPDDRAARLRLREAKSALSAVEQQERDARRRWQQAQRELESAQLAVETARGAVEKAQRDLDRIHG